MRIKRLKLSGFKSFVEPAELRIEPGLTGVVGPNGCGKSNVLEAIRWVMGESSPKSMRGAGMDDVIFAGTAMRPARDFAEVSLLVERSADDMPGDIGVAPEGEIEVTRRIEREAGSAYRVNGRDVRAKDVALLFADAATGAHSPALVSQGKISAVIAAKPTERRLMLEEAAGIAGLHVRRKDAEQKLRAAEANLTRLDEVLAEMETRSGALRRQAKAAERYRRLSDQIREAEGRLIFARWREAAEAAEAAKQEAEQAVAAVEKAGAAQHAAAAYQSEAAQALATSRNAAQAAREKAASLGHDLATLKAERDSVARRIAELEGRRATLAADRAREAALVEDAIFMGDSGSMFVGFLLSGSVLLNQVGGRSRGIVAILAVPVMILFVPIFDTTFVTVLRKLWGRKASQGGRDHTSHRLVALGLSERSAVLMLYGFAVVAGGLALLVGQIGPVRSLALIGVFIVVLVMVGVYLSRVKVYEGGEDEQAVQENAVFAFLVNVSHKRRIFEVFLDAFLITLAYYSAWSLFDRSFGDTSSWRLFLGTLPLLVLIKLGSFLVVGVYRGLWRYTSVGDFITFAKGVALGSFLSVGAVLVLYRFQGFSRVVFLLDGILLLFAMIGSRMAFRVIRQVLPLPILADGRKVLIYGAGDGGEMVLKELNNNPGWNYVPIGFIDDDPLKTGKVMHGLTVFDGNERLENICLEKDVAEILISIRHLPPERLKNIREVCRSANVTLKRAQIQIEPIDLI